MPEGHEVVASAAGTIILVKWNSNKSGCDPKLANDANYVVIEHADGTRTLYLHLQYNSIVVKPGGYVEQGQVIARSGATGYTCNSSATGPGPHLHFQRQIEGSGSWWEQSIDIIFADVPEGKPAVGTYPISQNYYYKETPPSPQLPQERTATVLVMDVSGSMGQSWKGGIKLESAKNAAQRTIDLIEHEIKTTGSEHHIAIVTFSDDVNRILHLTPDYDRARQFIVSLGTIAWTNIGAGLQAALLELGNRTDESQRFIILLSDGMTNRGLTREQILSGPVAEARLKKICIHTVGFGDPGDIDEDFLRQIASGSGCGVYFYAGSGFELMNVYIKLRHISLGQPAGEFSSLSPQSTRVNLLTGMSATLGTVYIPDRQQALYFTLTWSEDGRLQARLIDPAGREITASYPGAQMRYFDRMVNIILSQPRSGWWTVAAYGESVPLRGTEYYAIISTRPGGLAIPIALPKVCLELKGQGINETICPAAPGILPPWLVITISVIVILVAVYLRLIRGGF